MTDKQYPPLPDVPYHECSPFDAAHRLLFTADQMRAYVDADRAQRLDKWTNQDAARQFHELCMAYRHSVTGGVAYGALVDWVLEFINPSRPDAGNTQE